MLNLWSWVATKCSVLRRRVPCTSRRLQNHSAAFQCLPFQGSVNFLRVAEPLMVAAFCLWHWIMDAPVDTKAFWSRVVALIFCKLHNLLQVCCLGFPPTAYRIACTPELHKQSSAVHRTALCTVPTSIICQSWLISAITGKIGKCRRRQSLVTRVAGIKCMILGIQYSA